jgi:prolipoprotein diacylglyceryl transferase
VLGVIAAVWIADRRYLRAGGQRGVIIDVATWAVPLGLVGARAYSVLTDYELYFGGRRDWLNVLKVWDGGIGMPGGIALGLAGAWIACRRAGVPLAPVAGAAAPAVAVGQAIGRWGNWFNQELYGRPSSLPWALQISPAHRLPGYESFATFQPVFLYESVWDLLTAVLVIWAARRFRLTGDRAFALYVALYSAGMFATQSVRIDYSHHIAGLRVNQWVAVLAFAIAVGYLYRTRRAGSPAGGEQPLAHPASAAPNAG